MGIISMTRVRPRSHQLSRTKLHFEKSNSLDLSTSRPSIESCCFPFYKLHRFFYLWSLFRLADLTLTFRFVIWGHQIKYLNDMAINHYLSNRTFICFSRSCLGQNEVRYIGRALKLCHKVGFIDCCRPEKKKKSSFAWVFCCREHNVLCVGGRRLFLGRPQMRLSFSIF